MASLPLKPCATPGCRALVRGQARCEKHEAEHAKARSERDDARRGGSAERGYDSQWRQLRRRILLEQPTCGVCRARPSVLVHHLNEVRHHPDLRLAESNLVGVCAPCHQHLHHKARTRSGRPIM